MRVNCLICHSSRFTPSLPLRQRKRGLAEHVAPAGSGADVGIAEPKPVLERFAMVRAFRPQEGGDDGRVGQTRTVCFESSWRSYSGSFALASLSRSAFV